MHYGNFQAPEVCIRRRNALFITSRHRGTYGTGVGIARRRDSGAGCHLKPTPGNGIPRRRRRRVDNATRGRKRNGDAIQRRKKALQRNPAPETLSGAGKTFRRRICFVNLARRPPPLVIVGPAPETVISGAGTVISGAGLGKSGVGYSGSGAGNDVP